LSVSPKNDAYSFFLCAVRESELASLNRKKKLYSEALKYYKKSANCFARALLAANGNMQEANNLNENEIIAKLSGISNDRELVLKPVLAVMMFDTNEALDENPEEFIDTSDCYQEALVSGRKILVHDLKHHEKYHDGVNALIFPRAVFKRLYFILILFMMFLVSLFAVYKYLEPVYNSNLVAQIFWRSDSNTPFNVEHSYSFPVREGKQFREYTIPFPDSVNISSLRVDPMHINRRNFAEIGIEWIRLLNKEGILLQEFTPKDLIKWSCTNCVKLTVGDKNIFVIRVNNKRPYLVSKLIDQEKVDLVSIKIRIKSKKTFWEWIFKIEK